MANNKFKADNGIVVSGNSEFYQRIDAYANAFFNNDLFVVSGNLTVNGTLVYANVVIGQGGIVAVADQQPVGNTTNRFNFFAYNVQVDNYMYPLANGVPMGNTTRRFEVFANTLNTVNITLPSGQSINSTYYSGTASNANTVGGATGTGVYVKTGPSTATVRTITLGSNGLSLTNGDGVAGDPTLSLTFGSGALFANTTGMFVNASALTVGTLPITRGGTGAPDRASALNNLLPTQNNSVIDYVLRTNGTDASWVAAVGPTGFTGSRGFTGSQGAIGALGYTGSAGTNGFWGSQGPIGFTGSTGFTGSLGGVGYTGSPGTNGTNGLLGYTGSRGFTGSQGSAGAVGFTGSAGTNGTQGPIGYTGSGASGSVGLNNGSAAAPSLYFLNATSTGLFRTTYTMGVTVGGTPVLDIYNSRVLTYKPLQVDYGNSGSTSAVQLIVGSPSNTGVGPGLYTPNQRDICLVATDASLNPGNPATLTQNGTLTVVSLVQTSDATQKTNIVPLAGQGLSIFNQLNGYSFTRIQGQKSAGVLAQELFEVLPDFVNKNEDGILGVDHTALWGYAIEAIKELSAKVESLEAKLKG